MGHISVISNKYNDDRVDEDILGYILNSKKTKSGLFGGVGVLMSKPGWIAQQFRAVRAVYNNNVGKRIHHIVVSFENRKGMIPQDAYLIGWLIAKVFDVGFQVVFAVHEDAKQLHIHFVINSVNVQTGYKWSMNPVEFSWLQEYIQKCEYAICTQRSGVYPQEDQELYFLLTASPEVVRQLV